MKQKLEELKASAVAAIDSAETEQDIEALRVKYLGKKGELTALL